MEPNVITPEMVKEKEEIKLDLPRMDEPVSHFDKAKNMFWVGIPIDRVDVFAASCIFDSQKLQYLNIFQAIMREMKEKQSKIVTPGMLNRMRDTFIRNKK